MFRLELPTGSDLTDLRCEEMPVAHVIERLGVLGGKWVTDVDGSED